jgi:PIN domain nuclease of toxin-antitoxin system
MKVLLDSHAFFWWVTDSPKLSRTAWAAIDDDSTEVLISSVVAWEIANKVRSGKWPDAQALVETFFSTMKHYGFEPLPLTLEHAHYAGTFRATHRDPFDRMLAAQSVIEGVSLVTADPVFVTFGTHVLW